MAALDLDAALAALDRLLAIAQADTGQSRRVANFLLAWWNAGECGGFHLPISGCSTAPSPRTSSPSRG
jgi:hypothetical protein